MSGSGICQYNLGGTARKENSSLVMKFITRDFFRFILRLGTGHLSIRDVVKFNFALDISEGLARAACAGEVNGEVVDLRTVVSEDCELNILTANDEKGLAALRHTASHVLAEAVKRLYPEAKLAIGPSIDTGLNVSNFLVLRRSHLWKKKGNLIKWN